MKKYEFTLGCARLSLLAVLFCAATSPTSALAVLMLVKYDDFENPTASSALWTTTSTGTGVVTLNEAAGGDGVNTTTRSLTDMSGAGTKSAFITATGLTQTFNAIGDGMRITWDGKRTNGGTTPAAINGPFYLRDTILVSQANRIAGGALPNGGAIHAGGSGTGLASTGTTTNDTWYHYDLSVTVADLSGNLDLDLKAYTYNSGLASDPSGYEALTPFANLLVNGSVNSSNRKSVTLGNPLEVMFGPLNADNSSVIDLVRIDNVYIEQDVAPVPEPSSLLLLGSILALACRRRRRCDRQVLQAR